MNEYNEPNMNASAPAKKSGNKALKVLLISGIAVSVMVIAALAATVAVSVGMNTPMNLVMRGAENSLEALEDHPVAMLLSEAAEGGSVELMLQMDPLFDAMFGYYGIDLSGAVGLKFYGDSDNDRAAVTAGMELDGVQMLDASVLVTEKEITVMSDSLLGDEVYGVYFETAADKLETSVFGPDGYLSLDIDSLDSAMENFEQTRELREDAEIIAAELTGVVTKSLKEHAELTKENEELAFAGESTRVTAVKIALDREGYVAVLRDVIAYLKESESVRNYAEKYTAVSEEQDSVSEFYLQLDEAESELEYFDGFERLIAVFYITKQRTEMVGVDLKMYDDADAVEPADRLELRAGPSLSDPGEISLNVVADGEEIHVCYEVLSDDETEYRAELIAESYGEEQFSIALDWNRESGALSVVYDDGYSYMEVKGSVETGKDMAELRVTNINIDGEKLDLDLRVTVKTRDEFPVYLIDREYTEILDLTNGDLEMLAGRVSSRLMNKIAMLDESLQWILAMLFM